MDWEDIRLLYVGHLLFLMSRKDWPGGLDCSWSMVRAILA